MQIMEGPFAEEKKKNEGERTYLKSHLARRVTFSSVHPNEGERTYLKSHLARRVTFSSVHPSSMVVSEQDRSRDNEV